MSQPTKIQKLVVLSCLSIRMRRRKVSTRWEEATRVLSFCASQEPHRWAEQPLSGAEMSDVRRTDRIVAMAEAMAATPGGSIPRRSAHP